MNKAGKISKVFTILVLLGLVATVLPRAIVRAQGMSLTLKPAADAYVIRSSSGSNYGSNIALRVDDSPTTRAYLRFDVKGLNGARITRAQLKVYANSSSDAGYLVKTVSSNTWGEKTITFANAPAPEKTIAQVGRFSGGRWTTADVSASIRSEGVYSLVLTGRGDTAINLASREAGANAPQLVLDVDGAISTPATAAPTGQPTAAATSPTNPSPTNPAPTNPPASGETQPGFPIRAAFYYPWFPEAWNQQGMNPFTNYTPSLGFYSSSDPAIIQKHIQAMQYGNIQAGIASWWGQGSRTDQRMAGILAATAGTGFRWAVYYENEASGDPSVSQIQNDLTYLRDHYGNDPSFLRINNKFVVFVYAGGNDACGMADRWKKANTVGAYVVLKVFPGYDQCASQPDGWHQYSPAVAADSQGAYSFAISPGFWKGGDPVRLGRDLARWTANVKAMVASGAKFQLITTFNEWGEGTAVESAKQWASPSGYGQYLDVLHANGNASAPAPTSQPTKAPTTAPTSVPTSVSTAAPTMIAPTAQPTALPTSLPTSAPTTAPTSPVPAPAGDQALVAAGDIASCASTGDEATAALVSKLPGTVAAIGDTVYEEGTTAQYTNCYQPTWGAFKSRTRPAVGNHEYNTSGATGYYTYFGSAAGPSGKGYYSYDLGSWHVVVLNSECSKVPGGCGAGSAQEQWLKADLAAHPTQCTLAYYHEPRYSSGEHGNNSGLQTFWSDLVNAGVDLVLNGHDHDYERFAPMDASGKLDNANGLREIVVGTGGRSLRSFSAIQPNSLARNSSTYGVLKLTLHAGSYDWQFVPQAGKTFADSGSGVCH